MSTGTSGHPLRLMETFRSVFYTPIYVAVSGGYLKAEGLEVAFSTIPSGYHGLSALNGGVADIVQSGAMRSIIAADWGAESVPQHFIEINSRDGFFLVGRHPADGFDWSMLKGSTLIPVGFSPMPIASLGYALRKVSVDIKDINLVEGHSLVQAMDAFHNGVGDYIHLPQPAVEQVVDEGWGHRVAAMGTITGHIAYSSFVATHRYLEENREVVERFTRGFYAAQQWIAQSEPGAIAELVAPYFPDLDKKIVTSAIARYRDQDTWATDPLFREDGFDSLQAVLLDAGLIGARQSYDAVVNTEFARAAMS